MCVGVWWGGVRKEGEGEGRGFELVWGPNPNGRSAIGCCGRGRFVNCAQRGQSDRGRASPHFPLHHLHTYNPSPHRTSLRGYARTTRRDLPALKPSAWRFRSTAALSSEKKRSIDGGEAAASPMAASVCVCVEWYMGMRLNAISNRCIIWIMNQNRRVFGRVSCHHEPTRTASPTRPNRGSIHPFSDAAAGGLALAVDRLPPPPPHSHRGRAPRRSRRRVRWRESLTVTWW